MVMHVCDFYITVLFYQCLLGDRKSVGIYLLFLHFPRKGFANLPNEHFSVLTLFK